MTRGPAVDPGVWERNISSAPVNGNLDSSEPEQVNCSELRLSGAGYYLFAEGVKFLSFQPLEGGEFELRVLLKRSLDDPSEEELSAGERVDFSQFEGLRVLGSAPVSVSVEFSGDLRGEQLFDFFAELEGDHPHPGVWWEPRITMAKLRQLIAEVAET